MPLYDIKNPTPADRVIYDGFPKSAEHPKQREVYIPAATRDESGKIVPGVKLAVKLHESVAEEMQQRVKNETAKDKHNSELVITLSAAQPEEKAPAPKK